jgi:hypothetical protein
MAKGTPAPAPLGFPTIFVSSGRRGLEIEFAPRDLVSLHAAEVMDVIASEAKQSGATRARLTATGLLRRPPASSQ